MHLQKFYEQINLGFAGIICQELISQIGCGWWNKAWSNQKLWQLRYHILPKNPNSIRFLCLAVACCWGIMFEGLIFPTWLVYGANLRQIVQLALARLLRHHDKDLFLLWCTEKMWPVVIANQVPPKQNKIITLYQSLPGV